jgi:hypothetical protein
LFQKKYILLQPENRRSIPLLSRSKKAVGKDPLPKEGIVVHRIPEDPIDAGIENLRNAVEHRATWFYLLMDEARKRGVPWEEIARSAVYRCGCLHGERLRKACANPESLPDFEKVFAGETGKKVFAMEIVTSSEDELEILFHYCPLVSAWRKLGSSPEDLALLCDIAMDGDRGITRLFPAFSFELGDTIAQGHPSCRLRFLKNRGLPEQR